MFKQHLMQHNCIVPKEPEETVPTKGRTRRRRLLRRSPGVVRKDMQTDPPLKQSETRDITRASQEILDALQQSPKVESLPSKVGRLPSKVGSLPSKGIDLEQNAIVIQRIVRGRLARSFVRKKRRELARKNGVLVACEGTRQGFEGWYEHDGPEKYYFKINRDRAWELIYGPLDGELWQELKRKCKIGIGLLALPGTTVGGSGLYVTSNFNIIRVVTETPTSTSIPPSDHQC